MKHVMKRTQAQVSTTAVEHAESPAPLIAVFSRRAAAARDLGAVLSRSGYRVLLQGHLDAFLARLDAVDAILLQAQGESAELCAQVRGVSDAPLLVIEADDGEQARIAHLDRGADVVLPWSVGNLELVARIRACLRRNRRQAAPKPVPLGTGRLLDLENSAIILDGRSYGLTPTETRLLRVLAEHLGEPVSTRTLVTAVWTQQDAAGGAKLVSNNLARIRRKLEVDPRDPRLLRFLRGRGWILCNADDGPDGHRTA